MTTAIVSKQCARCKQEKPLTEFYIRNPYNRNGDPPALPGDCISECKTCMRERGKHTQRITPDKSRVESENLAIAYLRSKGIYATPGKASKLAWVDVAAWGAIGIEVKHAKYDKLSRKFTFVTTPKQQSDGFSAHLVLLMCEYEDRTTYHIFPADHPVFYINGRVKSGLVFSLRQSAGSKHSSNRVVMTQALMDEYENRINLIWALVVHTSEALSAGEYQPLALD